MAEQSPIVECEDISLDEARRIAQGPRMDPELYHALKEKIQSLGNVATRLTVSEGTSTATMKNHILRVAAELGTPVTVCRVPGGLLFWRSTDEDRQQVTEVAARLQAAQQPPQATRRDRRRRG
jgi:hypothetical protein